MGKGGSAPQPTTQTVQQSNIPEYARPYFEDIMTRGTTASNVEYQPYQGQRVAEFTPMQQQAFQNIENLGVSPLVQQGAGLTGLGANLALQSGQYQPMAPQQTFQAPQFQGMGLEYLQTQAPQLQQFQMGPTPMARAALTGAAAPVSGPDLQQYQMGPAERAQTGSFAMPERQKRTCRPTCRMWWIFSSAKRNGRRILLGLNVGLGLRGPEPLVVHGRQLWKLKLHVT